VRRDRALFGALVVAAVGLGFALATESNYRFNLATLAGIYAISAIGLNLLFGGAGQISLGHAGFVGIGAWAVAALTTEQGWPWVVAAPVAMVFAGLIGVVLGYAALRIEGHYLALATLAFGFLFVEVMDHFLVAGVYGIPPLSVFGFDLDSARLQFLGVWLAMVLVYLLSLSFARSRVGRALAALRDDPLAAASCGVNIARAKITVFTVSAVLGGLAGALFAPYQGSVTDESFGFLLSVNLLIMIVIGGLGSPIGAVLGALFLVIVPEFGREYERVRLLVFGAILVAAVVLFPGGLAGVSRRIARSASRSGSRIQS
jgi:branched-chain amino acid transport system permease protein